MTDPHVSAYRIYLFKECVGIIFHIHSVRLTSLVSIHLLIDLSTRLSHHPHCHHPSLLHSFTPGSKPTFTTNPSHLRLFYLLDYLIIMGLDRTCHAHHFIFSFKFLNFVYSVWQTTLAIPVSFYCTLNTHYRIASYCIVMLNYIVL